MDDYHVCGRVSRLHLLGVPRCGPLLVEGEVVGRSAFRNYGETIVAIYICSNSELERMFF